LAVEQRFQDFMRERKDLLNVSDATLYWYRASFRPSEKFGSGDPKRWVVEMREHGLSPVSINTHICALNVFWKWAGEPTRLAYLKEEQTILQTLNAEQTTKGRLRSLVRAASPKDQERTGKQSKSACTRARINLRRDVQIRVDGAKG
jgi:hypothetical protein